MALLQSWLNQGPFMPHGMCYLWTPGLVWLHVGSDTLIAFAYTSIPLTLLYVVRKRTDLPFHWMFVLFGVFIVACGATHAVEVWNVWHGDYWFSGMVKFVTAIASVSTAILLVRLIPKIMDIPTREELAESNRQLAAAYEELEQFSYAVSHDLRAPLRSVEGFGRALEHELGDGLNAEGRHYLNRMREGSHRMGQLIDDLLRLSRLSREHITLTDVNVSELAEQVVEDCQDSNPRDDVSVRIQSGMRVICDKNLLRVVLDNLVRNAWKFTATRNPAVIEIGMQATEQGEAFFVEDNGVGFDMRYVDKLFTIFQRLHSSEEFEGNGVGLATVRRIVQRHNGNVWAVGREGEGATFFFRLGEQD